MRTSIAGSNLIFPFHSVNSQLKNSTPVGTEISSVVTEKKRVVDEARRVHVVAPHRERQRQISIRATITHRYPYSGFRLNTGTISDTIPQAPMMSM